MERQGVRFETPGKRRNIADVTEDESEGEEAGWEAREQAQKDYEAVEDTVKKITDKNVHIKAGAHIADFLGHLVAASFQNKKYMKKSQLAMVSFRESSFLTPIGRSARGHRALGRSSTT